MNFRKLPPGLIGAIAIVFAVELALRCVDPHRLIAYRSDNGQYEAVREYIRFDGSADVALIGSSQMREGVSMPDLINKVHRQVAPTVTVANYATRGAKADGMGAVVDYLLRDRARRPELIVIGLSVRDLRTDDQDWPRLALFWNEGEWLTNFRQDPSAATSVLPTVVRNFVGQWLYTLNYREKISNEVQVVLTPFARLMDSGYQPPTDEPNPIIGQTTWQHSGTRGLRDLTLTQTRATRRRQKRGIELAYEFNRPPAMSPVMSRRLSDMLSKIKTAGIRCVIVEMPVAPELTDLLKNSGQRGQFLQTVEGVISGPAGDGGRLKFIPLERQHFQPTNLDFSDLQHFNRIGAEQFNDTVSDVIAAELSTAASK